MADIGATNVTYTIRDTQKWGKKKLILASLAFGNGVLTYPSGGVPLTTTKFGVENVNSVQVLESNGKALIYEWDRSANTLRIINPTQESNANTNKAGVEYVAASTAPAATALEVEVIGY